MAKLIYDMKYQVLGSRSENKALSLNSISDIPSPKKMCIIIFIYIIVCVGFH